MRTRIVELRAGLAALELGRHAHESVGVSEREGRARSLVLGDLGALASQARAVQSQPPRFLSQRLLEDDASGRGQRIRVALQRAQERNPK
jgi:hypothetical protein